MTVRVSPFLALLVPLALFILSSGRSFGLEPYDFLMDPLESAMTMKVAVSVAGTELGSKELTEQFKGSFQNYYTPTLGDFKSLQVAELEGMPVKEKLNLEISGEKSSYFITVECELKDLRLVLAEESEVVSVDPSGKALVSGGSMAFRGTLDWEAVVEIEVPLMGKIEMGSVNGSESFEEIDELDFEFGTAPHENVMSGQTVTAAYEVLVSQTLNLAVEDLFLSTILDSFQVGLDTRFGIKGDAPAPSVMERASTGSCWLLYE